MNAVNKAIWHGGHVVSGLSQNSCLEMCSTFEFKYCFSPRFDNSGTFVSLPIKMAYHKHLQPSSSKEKQGPSIEFHFNVEDDDFQELSMVWCPNSGHFHFQTSSTIIGY